MRMGVEGPRIDVLRRFDCGMYWGIKRFGLGKSRLRTSVGDALDQLASISYVKGSFLNKVS